MSHLWFRKALLALALAGVLSGPGQALAATAPGTVVAITGLDDLNATAQSQAKTGVGKTAGTVIAMAGLAIVLSGHPMAGLGATAAGIAMAFMPSAVSSAFDATPAAPLVGDPQVSAFAGHWWTPATAGLYPVFLTWKHVQDPVFLVAIALLLALRWAFPARRRVVA